MGVEKRYFKNTVVANIQIKCFLYLLPFLLDPDTVAAAVLPDGFSSLGTSFCMSAWPNSHPGGRLLGTSERN